MRTSHAPTPSRLPQWTLFAFVGATVLAILSLVCYSLATRWVPARSFAGTYTRVVLPGYFALLVATLTLSYFISGNTLMHHYSTGTVQRDTSPTWFWRIVVVQALIAFVLAIVAYANWIALHG